MNVALDVFIIAVYMYLLEIDPLCLFDRSDKRREEVAMDGDTEINRSSLTLFRRPDKYHIGEDFDSFVEKLCFSFEAVDLTCPKKRRLALLSKLREEEFRIAESIDFPENNDAWQE